VGLNNMRAEILQAALIVDASGRHEGYRVLPRATVSSKS
jgi:hypothetical protein